MAGEWFYTLLVGAQLTVSRLHLPPGCPLDMPMVTAPDARLRYSQSLAKAKGKGRPRALLCVCFGARCVPHRWGCVTGLAGLGVTSAGYPVCRLCFAGRWAMVGTVCLAHGQSCIIVIARCLRLSHCLPMLPITQVLHLQLCVSHECWAP